MKYSEYVDTCCTELRFNLDRGSLPIIVDFLDVELFEPFLSIQLTVRQYSSLLNIAFRLRFYHYEDVK